MSQLTERQLFKLCVEQPLRLQKDFKNLNLQFIQDDVAADDKAAAVTEEQLRARVSRLYNMVWSGLTKYLNNMVHNRAKAVDIPGFCVVGPLIEEWTKLRDPLNKGISTKTTFSLKDSAFLRTVIMALHEDFVNSAGLSLDSRSDKAVVQYSKNPNDEVYKVFQG